VDAREKVALARVGEVVDRERGDDEVERPVGERILEAAFAKIGRGKRFARTFEHRRALVDPDELRLWMDVEHAPGGLSGADPEIEDPRRTLTLRRGRSLFLELLVAVDLGRYRHVLLRRELVLGHAPTIATTTLAGVVRLASVYPLVTARALARPFTYEVTDEVEEGAVVEVRLGGARQRGVVVETGVEAPRGVETAPVGRTVDSIPPVLVELALWIADYYGSTPGRALALVAPLKRARRAEKPAPGLRESLPSEPAPERLSAAQEQAVERIVAALDGGEGRNVLLYGATGSGKTEEIGRAHV